MEEERRRIIIPIGDNAEPQSKSAQSFFDTQSTKNAQPVVPLSGTATTGPAVPSTRSGKRKVLVVFLVTAVCAGIAAGLYMYLFHGSGKSEPQVAVQPVAGKTLSTLPWTHTPEEPVAQENAATDTQTPADRAVDGSDQKKANKQARAKPGKKKNANQADDPVKNTEDELHRIRDIFEGPP